MSGKINWNGENRGLKNLREGKKQDLVERHTWKRKMSIKERMDRRRKNLYGKIGNTLFTGDCVNRVVKYPSIEKYQQVRMDRS